jgi:hypothetical protein
MTPDILDTAAMLLFGLVWTVAYGTGRVLAQLDAARCEGDCPRCMAAARRAMR